MNQIFVTETIKQAHELLQQGNFLEALELFKKEIAEHPDNGYAHYFIGFILLQYQRYGNALTALNDAIRYLQDDPKYLAACFYYRACVYHSIGNMEQMLLDLEESILINPEVDTPFLKRGDYYTSVKEYEKAEEDYHNMSKLNPGNPVPETRLGQIAFAKENPDEAIQHYAYAIKLDPNYYIAYSLQAACHLVKCNFEEAIECYIKALELQHGYQDAERGLIYLFPDNCGEKICSHLKKLSEQYSNDDYWPFLIGQFYFFKGNNSEAISFYEEAFKRGGNSVMLGNIARAFLQMEEFPEAKEYAEKALSMNPDDDNAQYVQCKSMMEMEFWEEAQKALEHYAELYPENGTIQQMLADVYRFEDDQQAALIHAQRAVELSPEQPISFFTLSKIEHDLGNIDSEKEHLEQALSMVKEEENYNALRCEILQSLGCLKESFAELAKTEPISHWSYHLNMALSLAMDGQIEAARESLLQSFQYGFHRFQMLSKATMLEPLHQIPDFDDIAYEAEIRYEAQIVQRQFDKGNLEQVSKESDEVPFIKENESILVEGEINGLPLKFVFDTGASDTSISSVEVAFMLKHGYIEERDLGGVQHYRTAGGDLIEGTVVNLRNVKIGRVTFRDVRAAIIKNQDAPLLLGQSVLGRLACYWIDNDTQTLSFTLGPTLHIHERGLSCFAYIASKDGNHQKSASAYSLMTGMYCNINYAFAAIDEYFQCSDVEHALDFINEKLDHLDQIASDSMDEYKYYLLEYKRYFLTTQYRFEESLPVIEEIKTLKPNNSWPYYVEGWVLRQLNRLDEAQEQIQKAVKLEPDSIRLKLELGILAAKCGHETDARAYWKEGTQIECSSDEEMFKAECFRRLGDTEGCIEWIKKGLTDVEQKPAMNACSIFLDAATNYAAIGKLEEGDAMLKRSLEISTLQLQSAVRLEDAEYLKLLPSFQTYLKSIGEE